MIVIQDFETPAGEMILGSCRDSLCLCDWKKSRWIYRNLERASRILQAGIKEGDSEVILLAKSQLNDYFSGVRVKFDIPLLLTGTPFQKSVWEALMKIPYGNTVTYSDIAEEIGCVSAVRAVAGAIGANPISIIVPCHRVIGRNGTLTGYAGGLYAKRLLLHLELCNENGLTDFKSK